MHPFVTTLQKELRKEIETRTESLAEGRCSDYAAYQKLCGEIRGFALAEEKLLALAKKAERDDDGK